MIVFENLKITAKMCSPIVHLDCIRLDCLLSAAKAKEILQSDYYTNGKQTNNAETIIYTLIQFLEYSNKVFHASVGHYLGNRYVTTYNKRFDSAHDELIKFKGKGKQQIDLARGFFKNYHINIDYNASDEIIFFARGDKKIITDLLNNYIGYIGKKSSQGYGFVKEWQIEQIEADVSLMLDNMPMRYLPALEFIDIVDTSCQNNLKEEALIPPAWRQDCRELCIEPIDFFMKKE